MADNQVPTDIQALASAIAQGIAEANGPKKVSNGQYEKRQPAKGKCKYVVYQNGFRVPEDKITPVRAALLNRVTRSGRYINRLVEVALWDDGGAVSLDLRYTNNTPDSRFELKNHFRNFEELVTKIVEEQDVILAKAARQQKAVDTLLEQTLKDEEPEQDVEVEEPRIESVAQTPRQEAAATGTSAGSKKAKSAPFSSARVRKARADAGL